MRKSSARPLAHRTPQTSSCQSLHQLDLSQTTPTPLDHNRSPPVPPPLAAEQTAPSARSGPPSHRIRVPPNDFMALGWLGVRRDTSQHAVDQRDSPCWGDRPQADQRRPKRRDHLEHIARVWEKRLKKGSKPVYVRFAEPSCWKGLRAFLLVPSGHKKRPRRPEGALSWMVGVNRAVVRRAIIRAPTPCRGPG